MTTLDRASPVPLWSQLADDLRERLADGSFGERLPSEQELVAEYGVSRNTVREAMRRLSDERLVQRQRGRGTTPTTTEFERMLPGMYSLARTIEDRGLPERSLVRALDIRSDSEASNKLNLSSDADLVYIERLRFAGDDPLALDRSWLPATVARPLCDADLSHGSLYDALRELCGTAVNGGWERIMPVVPSNEERATLAMPRGVAAFRTERVSRCGRLPVEWRVSLVRGDRYGFVSTWPGARGMPSPIS